MATKTDVRTEEFMLDYLDNANVGLHWVDGNAMTLWANKADYGLSYHRSDGNVADLCVTKVRMGYPGRKGSVKVAYDFRKSAFVEAA